MLTLGSAIKKLRQSGGISQKDLAREIGVTPSYLSHVEAGRREPSIQMLREISEHLDVPPGLFLAVVLQTDLPAEKQAAFAPLIQQLVGLATDQQLAKRFSPRIGP